jgi:RHS repeat-associated protein
MVDMADKPPPDAAQDKDQSFSVAAPQLSLPKGGGAIRGIGEKFAANPATGAGSLSVPICASPGRSGFGPQHALSYGSSNGNGPFGFGWSLTLPMIVRKTDKGLPQYVDRDESDVFILSGHEDLMPALVQPGSWERDVTPPRTVYGQQYAIHRYRPRVEGLFARIERWINLADPTDTFWRSISKENVTTWYGKTAKSRIFDPADASRVFSWLICESYDGKGNVILYDYKPEDSTGVDLTQANERNRSATRSTQRYIKSIYYGNRTPYFPDLTAVAPAARPTDWCFQLVFDYGEHDLATPVPHDTAQPWSCRLDPFSTYRATFEVRTYRLCRRVLMFHSFPDQPDVLADCLVRSTDLAHASGPLADPSQPFYSYLLSVTQSGYVRNPAGGYLSSSLPPLEFAYTVATVDETVRDIDAESLQNLPGGLDGSRYRWVDLDGEGVSGILSEHGPSWFYKPNFSPANRTIVDDEPTTLPRFGPTQLVARRPSLAALSEGHQQLMSLSGDGQLDLVAFDGPMPGYYERTDNADWEPFQTFASLPVLDWQNPNLKFIDLTGDGFPDLLISEDYTFCWHTSLAADGFGPGRRVSQAYDEEQGPRLVFADGTESIFLADMSGDGLTDLVRIRPGEVCYWPNLGYGRFGAKVAMDGAPRFDRAEVFDGRRIRLADIDGSGTADIVYFAANEVRLYFNQSGNAWGAVRTLSHFPAVESVSSAAAFDLLGTGTACLVWSSPLAGNTQRQMRYIDLMGGEKPHLLVNVTNNLGAETRVDYAPSTKFYVADKLAGTPWLTRLPFPVQVVERVETYDYVSRNRFVTRYAYHHGYYDGVEREFRGFGRVDQWDARDFATLSASSSFPPATNETPSHNVPPTLTKTWFHTGAFFGEFAISKQLEMEYYDEGDANEAIAGLTRQQLESMLLDDTVLPTSILLPDGSRIAYDLSGEEMREACRALCGSILRQETYGLDGSEAADRPYSVSERNYTIEVFQPHGPNQFGVFLAHPREAIEYHYERKLFKVANNAIADPPPPNAVNAADPRVTHAITLAVDPFGNILQSVAVAYGRRYLDAALTAGDQAKQSTPLSTYSENLFTNVVLADDAYRAPLPAQTSNYELLQFTPAAAQRGLTSLFDFTEVQTKIAQAGDGSHDVLYENLSPANLNAGEVYRRLIECARTYYRPDDMGAAAGDQNAVLALQRLESLALAGNGYKLAFTPGLISQIYQRGGTALLQTPATVLGSTAADGCGYVDLDGNGQWWASSGRMFYFPTATTPAAEKAEATQNFYLPRRYVNSFGNAASVDYDKPHDLMVVKTTDAAQNIVSASNDYRVLASKLVTDANGNRSAAQFDILGMVVGTAVMGKVPENLGDSFTTFAADLSQAQIDGFYAAADPHTLAGSLLGTATTRIVYDVLQFYNARRASPDDPTKWLPTFAATIARETHESALSGEPSKLQIAFSYSDGFAREIQKKMQAEPGPVVDGGPAVDPRWVGSGWTIFNNKGKPVRQYEPFFSQLPTQGHQFEFAAQVGVSPILCYDPLDRVVLTVHPDKSYEKFVFDPWRQASWDGNDTVLQTDPTADPDVGAFFKLLPSGDYAPTWYTQRAGGGLGAQEQDAASKAAVHAATPAIDYFDTLSRIILKVADNGAAGKYLTRIGLDIQGNQRAATDALQRTVLACDYDMLKRGVRQSSMEAGELWTLTDGDKKPIRAWDSRGHNIRTTYDMLRRPTGMFVLGTDAANSDRRTTAAEVMFEKIVYGEGQPPMLNLNTRVYQHFDAAGVFTNMGHNAATNADEGFDFKGNLLRSSRSFVSDYKGLPNWSAPAPTPRSFASSTQYDALNRPTALTTPDGSIVQPTYNEANFIETISVNVRGAAVALPFVTNVDYDAKGQRILVALGSAGTTTSYAYDRLTFRLVNLTTTRPGAPAGQQVVQNLSYTYDPIGNITHIEDDADIQNAVFFRNRRVDPSAEYTYDAVYRLIQASGREQLGSNAAGPLAPWPTSYNDAPRIGLLGPSDGNAMGTYTEQYQYDAVGNFLQFIHLGSDPANPGWTRSYAYKEASLLEAGKLSNRLSATTVGGSQTLNEPYTYDPHGNMTGMPQLQGMQWDFKDQFIMSRRQAVNAADQDGTLHQGERTYYVYDFSGQRVRKTTESSTGVKTKERYYLGTFELYDEYDAIGNVTLARETLHVMDAKKRIALLETKTVDNNAPAASLPSATTRYQFDNHIGSACLELDETANVISYEEYYPYGGTSYQAGRTVAEISLKRYRFIGRERDEETGLAYHAVRYFAAWLGRWTAADPARLAGGINLYAYCRCNPIVRIDENGKQDDKPSTAAGISISSAGVQFGSFSVQSHDNIQFSGLGPIRRVEMAPHVDEVIAVKGDKAGGVAGSPTDATNKQFSDPRTNTATKKNFVSNAPSNPRPNVSAAESPLEAGNRIITGRFSEVNELRDLSDATAAVTAPGERNNTRLRAAMKAAPVIRNALSAVGINPDTLKAENPPNIKQFPKTGTLNLSPKDADINAATGEVVPGPNTTAATQRRAERQASKPGASGPSSGGSGGGAVPLSTATAGALGDIGRNIVPGVAEGESALLGTAVAASNYTLTESLVTPLISAAEAFPVAAGAGAVGATAGHLARGGLEAAGVDKQTATAVGFETAVLAGAALGSFIPGVGTTAGAIIGAAVAGAFYLWSL